MHASATRSLKEKLLRVALASREGEESITTAISLVGELLDWAEKQDDMEAIWQAVSLLDHFKTRRVSWSHLRIVVEVLYNFLRTPPNAPATEVDPTPIDEEEVALIGADDQLPALPDNPWPSSQDPVTA